MNESSRTQRNFNAAARERAMRWSVPTWLTAISRAMVLVLFCAAGNASADSLVVLSGAGQSGLGGSAATYPIQVQARDAGGVVIAGRTIQWSTSNGFTLGAASSITDANGVAAVTFTYGDYGSTPITATDAVAGTQAQALVTAMGSDSFILVSGNFQAGQSGSTSSQPIVVELRNAAGTALVGRTVQWQDQTAYTQVNSASSITDSNGRASMGFAYLPGPPVPAGTSATIRASVSPGSLFVDASMTVVGFNVLRLVSASSQTGLVGSTGSNITVQLFDASGTTPVAGATINWSEVPGSGLVQGTTSASITDGSGLTTIGFQYVLPGSGDIRASYGATYVDMHFVSVGSDRMTLVSVFGVTGSANQASTSPIVVEMRDVNNVPIAGRTIQWTAQSDGDATVNAPTSVTNASGQASMDFNFGTAPRTTITALDPLTVNPNPADPNFAQTVDVLVRVIPNGTCCASMTLISGSGQTGLAGTAATQPIVVEVLDYTGLPAPGRTISWVRVGTAILDSTTSITDTNGRASMGFTHGLPGQTMIQAYDDHTSELPPHGNYVQAHVGTTGNDTVLLFSGDGQSGLVGEPATQPLIAEFRDASNAPIAGRTINWSVTAGNAVLSAASSVTDASGQAAMPFTYGPAASVNSIEARDPISNVHVTFRATGVGSNAISLLSGNGQAGAPGTTSSQPLKVEIRDVSGVPVAGRTVNWLTMAGDSTPTVNSSITDAAGQASTTFQFGTINSTITAQDSVTSKEVSFRITIAVPGNIGVILSGNGQSGPPGSAGAQPIVIELRDSNNLPLPAQAIAWSVISGDATLGTVQNATDSAGRASAQFNYGPSVGTSVIQAKDTASGQLFQASVTAGAAAASQILSKVSGDGQSLVANLPSEPLVVRLLGPGNAPVAGAVVDWTTDNGTLEDASTTTDANGETSNIVTPAQSGAVTVQASSPLAQSAVTFELNTGIASLPNLTPEQSAVAVAIDNLCPALASQSSLSPAQADLLARCREISAAAGLDGGATALALGELLADTAQAQAGAAAVAIGAQVQNVNARLMTLRSGNAVSPLNGLTLTAAGGVVPLMSLMNALSDDAVTPAGASFSRWGFFATGNIGRGEADAGRSTPSYDYDINGITAGIDYRLRDDWILGAALGYSRQDTDLDGDQGAVGMTGWSFSAYSTYSFHSIWYVDGVITLGNNDFKLARRIAYTLPTPGGGSVDIDQVASAKPGGDLFSGALTLGADLHWDAWGLSPYAQVIYTKLGFDAYEETLLQGPGMGLALAVDSRDIKALTGILGTRLTWTHSAQWGVFAPTASVEWTHEFKDDPEAITARFLYDPTQTRMSVAGEVMDSDYIRLGLGLSLVLTKGRSGFFLYQHMIGRDGQSQDNLSLGIRLEF